ncbi:hypothetical protein [Sulfurovum sp.]|uniref:hypothetical protein n=1 Tax=Sulfurovum sp. TaxID=1969726 RepID=UPI003568EAAB
MSNKSEASTGGIGFCGLLAIVFITLKLAGIGAVAAWSWWLVLSPIWAPLAFVLTVLLVFAVVIKLIGK